MTASKTHTFELVGDLGLREVAEILDRLRAALAAHERVSIVTDKLASVDLTIVQLLISAHKTALAEGKTLQLKAPAGGALRELLIKAGFITPEGRSLTPGGQLWLASDSESEAA